MPFPNLAGHPDPDRTVTNELAQAGIPMLRVGHNPQCRPEVRAHFIGLLQFKGLQLKGAVVVFSRLWYYWAARSTIDLPFSVAAPLNDSLGTVVRAYGYAGGTSIEPHGCNSWHIDTQHGLDTLVGILRQYFGAYLSKSTPTLRELGRLGLVNDAVYRDAPS